MTTIGDAPHLAANLVILAFAALEALRWRRGSYARTSNKRVSRRGTTAVLIGCYIVALLVVNWTGPAPLPLPRWVEWVGIAIASAGLSLRCWTVPPFATPARQPDSAAEQASFRGPYRVIRYPDYLGNLMTWSGATMASGNSIALITVGLAMLAAYAVRISAEEAELGKSSSGAPGGCPRQSWRLIPFVY